MKDTILPFPYGLTGLNRVDWIARTEELAELYGDTEPLGGGHTALFIDAGKSLLVSFESVATIRKSYDDNAPIGWSFVQTHGWSSLTILANAEPDWFRSPAVFGYFDRLIDDGFFDDFDNILFYGAGSAGYAAAAFSVAAPDARVLAIQPQATLDVAHARWDTRFPQTRRSDFTSRFGYAPRMVETAEQVSIIHDPTVIEDAMHASLFTGDNVTHLTCPFIGPHAGAAFGAMDILPDLLDAAMEGTLDAQIYAQLWRARQDYLPYLRTLMARLDASEEHPVLLARLCRAVSNAGNRPRFANRLEQLMDDGVVL